MENRRVTPEEYQKALRERRVEEFTQQLLERLSVIGVTADERVTAAVRESVGETFDSGFSNGEIHERHYPTQDYEE